MTFSYIYVWIRVAMDKFKKPVRVKSGEFASEKLKHSIKNQLVINKVCIKANSDAAK